MAYMLPFASVHNVASNLTQGSLQLQQPVKACLHVSTCLQSKVSDMQPQAGRQ